MANRFVVVDETGQVYDRTGVDVTIHAQDDGRTMKVFLKPSQNSEEEKAEHLRRLQADVAEALKQDLGAWYRHMLHRFERGN